MILKTRDVNGFTVTERGRTMTVEKDGKKLQFTDLSDYKKRQVIKTLKTLQT